MTSNPEAAPTYIKAGDPHRQGSTLPLHLNSGTNALLDCALHDYLAEKDLQNSLLPEKLNLLGHYDVPGMENAVAICHWSRSGTILLASYLDGHNDVLALPNLTGESIYPFLEQYPSLSLWEKLITYPAFSARNKGNAGDLFLKNNPAGDYATPATHYYAAVEALFLTYGGEPTAWIESRKRFFQFLHAAYGIANAQCPTMRRPVMVYAQHWFNDELARRLIADFPQARFIHTVRDPISGVDSWFDRHLLWQFTENDDLASKYRFPAFDTMKSLLMWDRAHEGMESRSRAIRFEDMHRALPQTMQRLADWLGIPFRDSLLESTLNGRLYVAQTATGRRIGANAAHAQRRSVHLSRTDRLVVFALFHDDFVAWGYPTPAILRRQWICLCILCILAIVPMRIELMTASRLVRLQMIPALKKGRLAFTCSAPLQLVVRRLRMMWLLCSQAVIRQCGHWQPLKPL